MGEKKQALRTSVLRHRDSLTASELSLRSRLIQEKVLRFPPYLSSSSVALYSPIGHEVATEEIRDHALRSGKRLFYPRLGVGEHLALIRVESSAEMKPGRYEILEPAGEQALTKQDQQGLVVFVPGLAFDPSGNRLGRGKGWYDRVLKRLGDGPMVIAIAFEFQIKEQLPTDEWDRRVHHIITEKRIVDCAAMSSRSKSVL